MEKEEAKSIASLVLGILSLLLFWTPLGLILGILAIVFGVRKKLRIARAGLIMGIIGIVIGLPAFAAFILLLFGLSFANLF
ncbi:hypothetical protein KY339_02190 [Candidatus Woesearchaeota archaeon]|nr:hypothetical protein [Candidatus Woesearchaeota archaeon]